MAVEIPLKYKYLAQKTGGRNKANGDHSTKRAKRPGSGVGDRYDSTQHVLVIVEGRKRKWLHTNRA